MVAVIVYASDWVEQEHIDAYLDAFGFPAKIRRYKGAGPKNNGQNAFSIRGSPPVIEKIVKGLDGRMFWKYELLVNQGR